MKLYATVTSERATKGQGGNDHINIELRRGHVAQVLVYRIHLTEKSIAVLEGLEDRVLWMELSHERMERLQKGEKQKDECKCPKDYHDMFVKCRGY